MSCKINQTSSSHRTSIANNLCHVQALNSLVNANAVRNPVLRPKTKHKGQETDITRPRTKVMRPKLRVKCCLLNQSGLNLQDHHCTALQTLHMQSQTNITVIWSSRLQCNRFLNSLQFNGHPVVYNANS